MVLVLLLNSQQHVRNNIRNWNKEIVTALYRNFFEYGFKGLSKYISQTWYHMTVTPALGR